MQGLLADGGEAGRQTLLNRVALGCGGCPLLLQLSGAALAQDLLLPDALLPMLGTSGGGRLTLAGCCCTMHAHLLALLHACTYCSPDVF